MPEMNFALLAKRGWHESDWRTCRRLGIERLEAADAAMKRLWGHPLSVERDLRLPGNNGGNAITGLAQKRGQLTRQLQHELLEALE